MRAQQVGASLHCGVRSSPWVGVFGCGVQAPGAGSAVVAGSVLVARGL